MSRCSHNEVNPARSLNARSLNVENKFDEITPLVFEQQLDIFTVSETWLNRDIASDSVNIPGFSPMFRLGRSDGRKTGCVAFYISSTFASKRRKDLEHSDFELLFVEVKINSLTFICGVC